MRILLTIPCAAHALSHHSASTRAIGPAWDTLSLLAQAENTCSPFKAQSHADFSVTHVLVPPQLEWFVTSPLGLFCNTLDQS